VQVDSLHFLSPTNVRVVMSLTRYIQALCCIRFIYVWQRHGQVRRRVWASLQIIAYLARLDEVTNECAASKKNKWPIYAEQLAIISFIVGQTVMFM